VNGLNVYDRTVIIDCGSNPRRARSAAYLLARHLSSRDWRSLSELVVTHFDADHWEGLLRVVDHAPVGSGGVPPHLKVFFPAVAFGADRRLPAALMAFITATGPYGVQALDLRAAWRRLTSVQLVPLVQGDSFSLAGRLHEVAWPPRRLEERITQRLNKLVQRIEDEAEQLARDGYPQL
jgi:glyoxylase-like metal-dependent hydrolase (beta-lactamase superfamily II)